MFRHWFQTNERKLVRLRRQRVKRFIDEHTPQSADDFIHHVLPAAANQRQLVIALGVRRAIARFGCVPPEYIKHNMTFEELEALPNWDQRIDVCFDATRFYHLIEIETGMKVRPDFEAVPQPEVASRLSVREFVSGVMSYFTLGSGPTPPSPT